MPVNQYIQTDVVAITGTFAVTATGAVVDPSTITFKYQITNNNVTAAPTTLTYSGSSTPTTGTVARVSTGIYVCWLDTTSFPGFYEYEWLGTASSTNPGQGALPGSFQVNPLPI